LQQTIAQCTYLRDKMSTVNMGCENGWESLPNRYSAL